ncbi:Bgt-51256 [Blumeria graminis f. sp. tritici]|uniref:Bgt-51256 n=1 Tax=Blumeria graminis f. sp. tritici TaxID=62690 RepID=A0A9X9L7D8_BLUGR|nr:Bgt-51256 [Blumeria graminis f. sp. tritici]
MQTSPLSACLVIWLTSLVSVVQCEWKCDNNCVIESSHLRKSKDIPMNENREHYRLGVPDSIKDLRWRDVKVPDSFLNIGGRYYSYQAVYMPDGSVHSVWMIHYGPDKHEFKSCKYL